MGTKYSSQSISGYNASPPSDDGTVADSNKVKWSYIKTKLTDTVKTLTEAVNTALVTHFNKGPTAYTSSQTLGASHYGQFIEVSGSGVTLTLSDASALTAGWYCDIYNKDTANSISLARATASDTINATSADITILPLQTIRTLVIAAATGFRTSKPYGWIDFSQGANVASAATCDVWATADGKSVHITGTTGISSFGTAPHAGLDMWVIFDGALTITAGANLVLNNGGSNVTVAANDRAHIYADTTTKMIVTVHPVDGIAVSTPASSGSSLVLIESQTFSSTSLDFTTSIGSTYDEYVLVLDEVTQTNDNNVINLRVSVSSSFQSGASDYAYALAALADGSATFNNNVSSAATGIQLTNNNANYQLGNGAAFSLSGTIRFYKPSSTSRRKNFIWDLVYQAGTSDDTTFVRGGGAYIGSTSAIDGIRLLNGGGNMGGRATLYGVKYS